MKNTDKINNGQYGKFDTAEDLLSAYNALEAQFTKRCQLVKELQTALEHSAQAERHIQDDGTVKEQKPTETDSAQAQAADNFDSAQAVESGDGKASESTESVPSEIVGEPDTERQLTTDEARQTELTFDAVMNEIAAHAVLYAEALSAVPEIMNACVALYKQRRLSGEHLPSPHGAAVLTPVKRPNSLAEAKKLADTLLGL